MKRNCVTCDGCGCVEYTPSTLQTMPEGWITVTLESSRASTRKHLCVACSQPPSPSVVRLFLEFKSAELAGGKR